MSILAQDGVTEAERIFPGMRPCPLITESDILHSPFVPSEFKPLILYHYLRLDAIFAGYQRETHSELHHLVVAERLARMTIVLRSYESLHAERELLVEGVESETLVTDLLEAALSWRTWRGMWAQGVLVPPPCLQAKEKEVAELVVVMLNEVECQEIGNEEFDFSISEGPALETIWEDEELETASVERLCTDQNLNLTMQHKSICDWILRNWKRPSCHYADFLRSPVLQCTHGPKVFEGRISIANDSYVYGKIQRQTDNNLHHVANLTSALDGNLDHSVWVPQARSPKSDERALYLHWPPDESLANLCLMDKNPHRCHEALSRVQRALQTMSRYIRAFLHLWCLRCYRQRRHARTQTPSLLSRAAAVIDAVHMAAGALVICAVESTIAWTDKRVPQKKGTPLWLKWKMAWPRFFERGTGTPLLCSGAAADREEEDLVAEEQEEEQKPETVVRPRSFSCSF